MINKDNIKIHLANTHDFENILYVNKNNELGPTPTLEKDFTDLDGGYYCTISVENNVVGIINFLPTMYEHRPDFSCINYILINQEYRNKGIGKKVIHVLEEYLAKEYHASSIFICVNENNYKGIKFWIKLGFMIVSGPILQKENAFVLKMQKNIHK